MSKAVAVLFGGAIAALSLMDPAAGFLALAVSLFAPSVMKWRTARA